LPDPGAISGGRGGKPATNRFNYGAAHTFNIPLQTGLVTSPITVSGDRGQCRGCFAATIFYSPGIPELHRIPVGTLQMLQILLRPAYT
jgi:hypothetical protein